MHVFGHIIPHQWTISLIVINSLRYNFKQWLWYILCFIHSFEFTHSFWSSWKYFYFNWLLTFFIFWWIYFHWITDIFLHLLLNFFCNIHLKCFPKKVLHSCNTFNTTNLLFFRFLFSKTRTQGIFCTLNVTQITSHLNFSLC